MNNKTFKILSIDGGGIRGVFPAHILHCISKKMRISLLGEFNMIAGTSTGAIIAAAVACDIDPTQILSFYRENGKNIFNAKWPGIPWKLFRMATCGLYYSDKLNELLTEVFGDIRLGEVKIPLLLPASDIGLGGVHVFKSSYCPTFFRDNNVLVRDAVIASCSAPTFYDPWKVEEYLLADGGLWANNPSLAAYVDAQHRLNVSADRIRVLSIGTGHAKKYYGTNSKKLWGLMLGWGGAEFIEFLLSLQAVSTNNYLKLMINDRLLRLNFESDNPLPLDDYSAIDDLVARADKEFTYNSDKILKFFEE